ncbi:MAG: hypothetical protein U0521_11975 [Anaerolineae bacterium]
MYHFPLLYTVLFLLMRAGVWEDDSYRAFLYTVTVSGTMLLSFASYRWFQVAAAALKTHFQVEQRSAWVASAE